MSALGIYVRWQKDAERVGARDFPAPTPEHAIFGVPCMACGDPLGEDQAKNVTLLALGPGEDEEKQQTHRDGGWYSAEALPMHSACLGMTG